VPTCTKASQRVTTASLRIAGERWIEWTSEKQLRILPLRVRMTAVVMVQPEKPDRRFRVDCHRSVNFHFVVLAWVAEIPFRSEN
jgi:hypothetical protein